MDIFKGENIIVEGLIVDKDGNAVNFADLTEMTATAIDVYGNSTTYTKTLASITQGTTASSYRFEITKTQTTDTLTGLVNVFMSFQFTDATYSLVTCDIKKVVIGILKPSV